MFPVSRTWLLTALLVGLLLRSIPILEKQFFKGDEIRSYLAATAHQGEYKVLLREQRFPVGAWASAAEWKRLIQPEIGRGLAQVAHDLAMWDVHPPLYFWFLHVWSHWLGVNFGAGAFLNLLFEVAILFVVTYMMMALFQHQELGSLTAVIWWLSPTVVRVSPLTRSYILLTLICLLFTYTFHQALSTTRSTFHRLAAWSLAAVTACLGLLTHYLFILFIAASLFFVTSKFGAARHRILLLSTALLIIAGVTFVFIYPDFFWAFTFLLEPRTDFVSGLWHRIFNTLSVNAALLAPFALGVLLALSEKIINCRASKSFSPLWVVSPPYLTLFVILPLLGVDFFYILLISPHHAMGPHYVYFVTPMLALFTSLILMATHNRTFIIKLFLVLSIALNLLQLHPAIRNFGFAPRLAPSDLRTDGVLLFDHLTSIHWFNLVLHLPDEQIVFVADQANLLADPLAWSKRLLDEGGLYVSFVLFSEGKTPATFAAREQIITLLRQNAEVTRRAVLQPLQLGELAIYEVTSHLVAH